MHANEVRDRISVLLDKQDEILRGAKGDRLGQRDAAQYDRNDAEIRQLERDLLTAPGQDGYGQDPIKPGTAARGYTDGRENRLGQWLAGELRGWVGTGTTGGGSFTPTGFWPDFWDLLASSSVGLQSGFTRITTDKHELVIPHLTADTTSGWWNEAETITSTDATAAQITATPRKLAALQALSNEVIADSNPSVLDVIGRSMVRSIGLKFDLGVFQGNGVPPEISGLADVSGIQEVSMGTDGDAIENLDPFADAIGLLEAENAEATAIVMHPRTWKTVIKLKETTTSIKPLVQDEAGGPTAGVRRSIYGVPVYLTSQISIVDGHGSGTNTSSVYVYQASEVIAVMREDVRVELDRSRLFNSDQSELRAIMRADLVVPNPKAVVRIKGITA